MKLLYIWISEDQNKFFISKDFNFTEEYSFSYNEHSQELNCKVSDNPLNAKDFFTIQENKNNVEMVSAIVGANGSGKTTLLKYIFKSIINSGTKIIRVYEIDKKILIYFHNVKITNCKIDKNKDQDINEIILCDYEEDRSISKIFLSNSEFDYLNDPRNSFTGYDLGIKSEQFFRTDAFYKNINFQEYVKMLFQYRPKKDYYEGLLFLNYYQFIKNKDKDDFYSHLVINSENTISELTIHYQNLSREYILRLFNEIYDKYMNCNSDKIEFFCNEIDKGENFRLNIRKENKLNVLLAVLIDKYYTKKEETLIRNFYKSFLLEFIVVFFNYINRDLFDEIFFSNDLGLDIQKLHYIKSKIYEEIDKTNNNNSGDRIKDCRNYFDEAYKILNQITSCKKFDETKALNVVELDDEILKLFTDEIKENLGGKPSFILKYIYIGSNLSSGERAFYRLFSWLYSCIDSKKIKKNILLIIDEIELYCHPEWQRKMVYELINSLNNFFPDKKIHLIYSTHSPITLSDMPSQYIIKLNNGEIVPSNNQTFGANIYDLLKDSFFIDDMIGEFACNKIDNAIQNIKKIYIKKLRDKELLERDWIIIEKFKPILNLIGDELIKRKLKSIIAEIENDNKRKKN